LKKVYDLFKNKSGISGKVTKIEYEDPSLYYPGLFKNLNERAQKEANAIAQVIGKQAGEVISVSEVRDLWDGYEDTFGQALKSFPKFFFGMTEDYTKIYTRRMKFHFAIK
jgi:hypothetical protein